jgi:hypothetical protein
MRLDGDIQRAANETRFARTVEQRADARGLLRLLLDDLMELLAEPAEPRNAPWIVAVVEKILENIAHQSQCEAQRDYFADVIQQFPSWHPQVEHLRQEHYLLEHHLREIRDRIRQQASCGALPIESYRRLKDWRTAFLDHDRRETALIQDAFTLEVGAGE